MKVFYVNICGGCNKCNKLIFPTISYLQNKQLYVNNEIRKRRAIYCKSDHEYEDQKGKAKMLGKQSLNALRIGVASAQHDTIHVYS